MNLFIIPSWYPCTSQPLSGIFTREQAEAIAELCPDITVMVSSWGHSDGEMKLRSPQRTLEAIKWRLRHNERQIVKKNGVWEIFTPALSWQFNPLFTPIDRLISVNRKNFRLAEEKFGPIDVIHAHVSYPGGYVASVIARESGVPYLLTEHMSPFPFLPFMRDGNPMREIVEAFTGAKRSIAVSPSLAERINSYGLGLPTVIPNFVDERRFCPGVPPPGKFIFFTLCGLTEQKGIDLLLHAIALWSPPAESFEFRIGGDGPMGETYRSMAQSLGIADRIKWLGHVSREEAPKLFQECHVYVMASRHETFGVVYAEAIACGKPVIATRCGGPEYIVTATNGRLVENGDSTGLMEAMQAMAEQWHEYSPQAIRTDFEMRFSRPAVVQQLRALYEEVTGE